MRSLASITALALWSGLALADGPTQLGLPALSRADFNRLAVLRDNALYWRSDDNKNGLVEPAELTASGSGRPLARWVQRGKLSRRFVREYRAMVELRRREAVQRELDAGRPTVVETDLRAAPAWERRMVRQLVAAGEVIERLYLRQKGAARLRRRIARGDSASKALFWRNAGLWCSAPSTRDDRFCNASPAFPRRRSESYPHDMEQDAKMCEMLRKHAEAKKLLDPFTVVRRARGKLVARPLTAVFGREMRAVAKRLTAAARALDRVPSEQALRRYLLAATTAFRTNAWEPADEAWVAMNSTNSRWYLRVAPDETYVDPCQQKAGFHLALAKIDPASLRWKRKLEPLRGEMERAIAKLIGRSYKARRVAFGMPDFIRVVLNTGDSRPPLGATLGQSLPNWGKVAREGRRTVVMSNLYTDADSRRVSRLKAEALLARPTLAYFTEDPAPGLLDTILHEAGHNFGPDSGWRIRGKLPKVVFGGALAAVLEELKAQTMSLWYTQLLRRKGLLTDRLARQGLTGSVMWAFGHISRGMVTPSGQTKPYSQLAAVQMGWLMDKKALTYRKGRFTIHFDKLPRAVEALMKEVGQIKATGDGKRGQALIRRYTTKRGLARIKYERLRSALLRYPKASFRYSVLF